MSLLCVWITNDGYQNKQIINDLNITNGKKTTLTRWYIIPSSPLSPFWSVQSRGNGLNFSCQRSIAILAGISYPPTKKKNWIPPPASDKEWGGETPTFNTPCITNWGWKHETCVCCYSVYLFVVLFNSNFVGVCHPIYKVIVSLSVSNFPLRHTNMNITKQSLTNIIKCKS